MIRGIPADAYPQYRGQVLPFLANFAARDLDGETVADFERRILDRDAQVWCINEFQALALTALTRDAVRITHAAGVRRQDWQEAFDEEIRRWGRALGKKRVVAMVRPGWARWGRTRGYREAHREMRIEL